MLDPLDCLSLILLYFCILMVIFVDNVKENSRTILQEEGNFSWKMLTGQQGCVALGVQTIELKTEV